MTLTYDLQTWPWPLTLFSDSRLNKPILIIDLDLWPMTLTFNLLLAGGKVNLYAKYQGHRSNGLAMRALTNRQTGTLDDNITSRAKTNRNWNTCFTSPEPGCRSDLTGCISCIGSAFHSPPNVFISRDSEMSAGVAACEYIRRGMKSRPIGSFFLIFFFFCNFRTFNFLFLRTVGPDTGGPNVLSEPTLAQTSCGSDLLCPWTSCV